MKTLMLLLLLFVGAGCRKEKLTPEQEAALTELLMNSAQTNFTITVAVRTNTP